MQEIVAPLLAVAAGKMEEMKTIVTRYELKDPADTTSRWTGSDSKSPPQAAIDHPSDPLQHPLEDPAAKKAVEGRKERNRELNKKVWLIKKGLWSAHDRKAFGDALKVFTEIVTKLHDLTVPSLLVYLVEGMGSRILPPSSLPVESRLAELEPYRRVAEDYPELKAELDAQVQAWKVETQAGNMEMEIQDLSRLPKFDLASDDNRASGNSRKRCIGTIIENSSYAGRKVLIEWKSYNREKLEVSREIKPRINAVTELLSYAPQKSKYRLLKSTGFFEDMRITNDTIKGWIGIIYELPPSPSGRPLPAPVALRELLGNPQEADSYRRQPFLPSLGDRFRLAQKLSEFVFHIHSCGWLHKGLRSDNIVFFSAPQMSIEDPYIVGWEYSRKEGNVEQTESMLSDNSEASLYVHPDQVKGQPYRRQFDHYQLGCLLIEIGHWKSLSAMRAKLPQEQSPENWTAYLTKRAEQMIFFMGKIYHEVTKRLLDGLESEWNAEFGPDIVWRLRECNA